MARQKYKLNRRYFEKIDTAEKAYWLGFLYADGCVKDNSGRGWELQVGLQADDVGHLRKLATALTTTSPLRANKQGYVFLRIHSRQLCADLIRQGCTQRKSLTLTWPRLRKDLYTHFVRGYIDGDGSICKGPSMKSWAINATGTLEFLTGLQSWLIANAGLRQTKLAKRKKVSMMQYTGTRQVSRIIELLYTDAPVYLARKKLAADRCLKEAQDNLKKKV